MFNFLKKTVEIAQGKSMWPNQTWLAWAAEQTKFSPDMAFLEEFESQLLFVYDDTMAKHRKNLLLNEGEMLCEAFTEGDFTVYKKKLGKVSFPIALKAKDAKHVNTFSNA